MPKIPEIVQKIRSNNVKYEGCTEISFSQMQIYYTCPYRWYLHYGLGHRINTSSIHAVFGTSMHETLQKFLEEFYGKRKDKEEKIVVEEYLLERMYENYKKEIENAGTHFSSKEELAEFYQDGVNILEFFMKKRSAYFSKRGWHLVGNEIPLLFPITEKIVFKGFLDTVMYHEPTDTIEIDDYKTSKSGWSSYTKKDEVKISQLILYKLILSQQFEIPEENIEIKYLILRRKINEDLQYIPKRIQEYTPPSGKIKLKKTVELLKTFVTDCYTKEGEVIEKVHPKKLTGCKFCPYNDKPELCNKQQ